MRLWSLHPSLLDRAALVAGWREGLLAQKVLAGETKGYTQHPQLARFRTHAEPMAAIGAYLAGLQQEAESRDYRFDASRIRRTSSQVRPILVNDGQLAFELGHLRAKVTQREPDWLARLSVTEPTAHPLFTVIGGGVEPWERAAP